MINGQMRLIENVLSKQLVLVLCRIAKIAKEIQFVINVMLTPTQNTY